EQHIEFMAFALEPDLTPLGRHIVAAGRGHAMNLRLGGRPALLHDTGEFMRNQPPAVLRLRTALPRPDVAISAYGERPRVQLLGPALGARVTVDPYVRKVSAERLVSARAKWGRHRRARVGDPPRCWNFRHRRSVRDGVRRGAVVIEGVAAPLRL